MSDKILTPHQNRILITVKTLSNNDVEPYATVQEISGLMGKPESSIRTTVYSLFKQKYLLRPLRGAYTLSDLGKKIVKE